MNRVHPRTSRWTLPAVAAALAIAVVTGTLAAATPASAVADGEDAPPEYRFAASLSMRLQPFVGPGLASGCSGALVAPKWVITAGHCVLDPYFNRVSGEPPYAIDVAVGTERAGPRTESRHAVRAVQAPGGSDAALIELDEPITSIAPLAIAGRPPAPGDALVLAGWGSTDAAADPTHRPDRLQRGDFEVARVAPRELSVSATGPRRTTSACPLDSGAPYVALQDGTPELVATVTNGPPCPHALPGTAARTDVIADWIAEQTGRPAR